MEKNLKSKRMSLDPAKNPLVSMQKHHNATELQVRQPQPVHEESQSSISNSREQYSPNDLEPIFDAISKDTDRIDCKSLYSLLNEEGYGDNLYSAVEMIALVDRSRKGHVTKAQFLAYFADRNELNEEKLPKLPPQMEKRKKWVSAIEGNLELMKSYEDRDYCQYVAQKLKEDASLYWRKDNR